MSEPSHHHPPTPSSEEEGEKKAWHVAPSSSEEGVGGGGVTRQELLRRAREMRNNPTEPERRLWRTVRGRQLGHKLCRQEVIGARIVDFFCPAKGLAIEIDGHTHDRERDLRRDRQMLREFGFSVIRFTNEDVMRNCDGVLTALKMALDAQPERWPNRRKHHPPTPSSEEEGE